MNQWRRLVALAAIFIAVTAVAVLPAWAGPRHLIPFPGASKVIVWNDEKAMDEAMSLIYAGVPKTHPELLLPLAACVVDAGTPAVVIEAGLFAGGLISSIVVVVDGKRTGCRGAVANIQITQE